MNLTKPGLILLIIVTSAVSSVITSNLLHDNAPGNNASAMTEIKHESDPAQTLIQHQGNQPRQSIKEPHIPAETPGTDTANSNRSDVLSTKNLQATLTDIVSRLDRLESKVSEQDILENKEQHSSVNANKNEKWFNREVMLSTGLTESEIMNLRQQYESLEMEKLYLRDRAIRDGWISSERYTDELGKIDDQYKTLRNNLDNSVYDTFLYATGRSNRVIVQDVMQNSPASIAGITAGDYILSYNNVAVYSAFDLRQAISSGQAGEEVKIDVERNGTTVSVYMPRGPMGIRMESQSIAPE